MQKIGRGDNLTPHSMEEGHGNPLPSMSMAATAEVDEIPAGLTAEEYAHIRNRIGYYHRYSIGPGRCCSLLAQRIRAPATTVWSVVRQFDRPQIYKHFVRSCALMDRGGEILPGCLREVSVISGLPASTSTERLDVLDEVRMVTGFTIIGGEHRLRNYRSITTVGELPGSGEGGRPVTVVLESYVVDVPEGNTEDDTRLFADTFVRLNLQKLASVTEAMASAATLAVVPPPIGR